MLYQEKDILPSDEQLTASEFVSLHGCLLNPAACTGLWTIRTPLNPQNDSSVLLFILQDVIKPSCLVLLNSD